MQVQQLLAVGKVVWKVGVFVYAAYARARKVFPFLSLRLLRNLFILRFIIKRYCSPIVTPVMMMMIVCSRSCHDNWRMAWVMLAWSLAFWWSLAPVLA